MMAKPTAQPDQYQHMSRFRFAIFFLVASISLALASSVHAATEEQLPLTASQLRQCALQIQTLRRRSMALMDQNQQLQRRLQKLSKAHAKLDPKNNDNQQAWAQYNARAADYNRDMARFRSDVVAINEIKQTYDQNCANRSFRQADFQQLSKALQFAMRAGLSDIRVPRLANPQDSPSDGSNHDEP